MAVLLTVALVLVMLCEMKGPPSVWSLIACGRCLRKNMRLQQVCDYTEILLTCRGEVLNLKIHRTELVLCIPRVSDVP